MGNPAARVGDRITGVCNHSQNCCPHNVTGVISQGANKTLIEGKIIARIGDKVQHNCPHCGTGNIVGGSSSVIGEGKGIARMGDKVVFPAGQGTIVAGANKTIIG